MSRNKNRLGGPAGTDATPPAAATQATQNTGMENFSFVVPTEFVELPSQGKFYAEGHPLHNQDCIEIRQMTAKEEDMLTSRTLLKKGVAIDRVLQSLIVDKRIDADSLLVGDRNALMLAVRVSGYGNDYITQVECPACSAKQKCTYDLNSLEVYTGGNLEDLNITKNDDGTFTTILPKTNLNITFKLLNGKDERNLLLGMKSDRQQKHHERGITRQLKNFIVAADGNTQPQVIDYVVNNIPSIDSRHLRLAYKHVAPTIDLTQLFICAECDFEQDMEVPLTADFFWPDR